MTEKRFENVEFTMDIISFDDNGVCKFFNEQDFEDWLNELNDKFELIKIDKQNLHHLDTHNRVKILELRKENHELQERNNRQAKRLGDLYRLIEQKDWRALSDIMDDFKKSDELLQKEWSNFE